MSKTLSATDICSRALRMIGAFPVTETAPDGEQLREAMSWLDLIMAEIAGTQELGFLQPATISMSLVAGQQAYDLSEELGENYPTNGIQFLQQCWLEDSGGNRSEVTIVIRETFEAHSDPDETGIPCELWVDQLTPTTIKTFPTLPADEDSSFTLKLVVQTFAPNVSPKGVTGTQPSASTLHQFAQAWQRYLIYRLAVDIGSGPVEALPAQRITNFQKMADEAWTSLDSFHNRERSTEMPIAEAWGA